MKLDIASTGGAADAMYVPGCPISEACEGPRYTPMGASVGVKGPLVQAQSCPTMPTCRCYSISRRVVY